MEYSLHTLNESSNLKTLTSQNLIDTLNLIGFEIDEVFEEQLLTNKNIANLRLLIKIPANREDLLSEKTFLNELSRLFNFSLQKKWEKSKIKYNAVLNTEYKNYKNFQQININSNLNDIVCFKIKIKKNKNFSTPLWIEKKLLNSGIQPKKSIDDLLKAAGKYYYESQKNTAILKIFGKISGCAFTNTSLYNNYTGYSNEEVIDFLKEYHMKFKVPLKKWLIEYYRVKLNPDLQFAENILESLGFKKCGCCKKRELEEKQFNNFSLNRLKPVYQTSHFLRY